MENIVYVAAPRDWFDYLATGATLVLSIIAVIIAVSTARKQNKIAVFDKRYDIYQCLLKIVSFSDELKLNTKKNAQDISIKDRLITWVSVQRSAFCLSERISFLPSNIEEQMEYMQNSNDPLLLIQDIRTLREQLTKDSMVLMKGEMLFNEKITSKIMELDKAYFDYVSYLIKCYARSASSEVQVEKPNEENLYDARKNINFKVLKNYLYLR